MRQNSVLRIAVLMVSALAVPALSFGAVILYGVDSASDSLVQIDPLTGNTVVVGQLDPAQTASDNRYATPISLAVRPSDQALFAFNNSQIIGGVGTSTGDLVTINPTTGAATGVGPSLGFDLAALAFSPSGQLYGLRGQLFTIDDLTGTATLVNTIMDNQTVLEVFGADFDLSGTLYAVALDGNTGLNPSLYTIDPATGVASLIGPLAFPAVPGSIVFSPGGQLMGADIDGNLYDIDKLTAALSNPRTLPLSNGSQGLGFVNPVPEPSTFGLAGAALALVGLYRTRRR